MLEIFQNQWVVGIGGGIISGIVVFIITRWLTMRKNKTSYYEKINTANAEIIRALKPYVVEIGLPDESIIDAIKLSTARKHQVDCDELYSTRSLCEDLMREIIENAYFSSDKKQELFMQLQQYLEALRVKQDRLKLVPDIERTIEKRVAQERVKYKRQNSIADSLTAASMTSIGANLFCINQAYHELSTYGRIHDFNVFIALMLFSAASYAIVIFILSYTGDSKRKDRKNVKKHE